MAIHTCQCRTCTPDTFPSGPRQGEHHFAVRLDARDCLLYATLNGAYLHLCTEAIAGRDGLAVVAVLDKQGRHHECGTCWGGAPCETVLRGVVAVTTERPEGA